MPDFSGAKSAKYNTMKTNFAYRGNTNSHYLVLRSRDIVSIMIAIIRYKHCVSTTNERATTAPKTQTTSKKIKLRKEREKKKDYLMFIPVSC